MIIEIIYLNHDNDDFDLDNIEIHNYIKTNKSDKDLKRLFPVNRVEKNNEYKDVEKMLKEKLGTKVKISNNKLTISFSTVQDLNRILEIMNFDINE